MTVSFLISQQNNIQRIRRCIENICLQYGEKRETGEGKTYYAFPSPDALAGLDEDTLKECNLGYRSKYVVRAAKSVVSGETDLEKIGKMKYPQAKAELMKLYGVGEKDVYKRQQVPLSLFKTLIASRFFLCLEESPVSYGRFRIICGYN